MNSVFAKTIYTGKFIISDSYLVFSGQKISSISKTPKGRLPGEFSVLTPAFIDPHSHIGMERSGEPSREEEANDQLDSMLALTDARDSVQMMTSESGSPSNTPWTFTGLKYFRN